MNKKKKLIVGVIIVILLLSVWGFFFIRINHKLPQAKLVEYPKNQWVTMQKSLEIKVEGMKFMKDAQIRKTKDIPTNLLYPDEMKLIWLTFKVRNTGKADITRDIGALSMESAGWSNIADSAYMQYIAGEQAKLNITFAPGEKQTFHLPYLLLSTNYRTSEWRKVENKKYWLTFRLYPKKERIQCN